MKGKKEDKALGKLFRDGLDRMEVSPSPELNRMLMRSLRRREFFHFIPRRFNIWYAGVIAAATGVVAVILLRGMFSGSGGQTVIPESNIGTPALIEAPAEQTVPVNKAVAGDTDRTADPSVSPQSRNNKVSTKANNSTGNISPVPGIAAQNPGQLNSGKLNKSISLSDNETNKTLKGGTIETTGLIRASAVSGCAPLKVRFSTTDTQADSLLWNFGDGGESKTLETEWLYDVEGTYTASLNLFRGGIRIVSYVEIQVFPLPEARFEIEQGNGLKPGEIQFRNYSTMASRYKWSFGDGNTSEVHDPVHSYEKPGPFRVVLTAISAAGCIDTVQVMNDGGRSSWFVEFPNAFIPNTNGPSGGYYSKASDEAATVFHPSYSGIAEYQLRIYTRRGILLFESNDVEIGWDGYYKGQLCDPGVYVWKVRGAYINGEPFTRMGDITLIKE